MLVVLAVFYTIGCGTSNAVTSTNNEEVTEQNNETEADTSAQLTQEELQRQQELKDEYREELNDRFEGRANGITTYYVSAQRLFYQGKYNNALYHINKAAEIKETADILALRGSIYLGIGNMEKFKEQWALALEMDRNVPIPNVPYLIQQLKAEGLISENYNPDN